MVEDMQTELKNLEAEKADLAEGLYDISEDGGEDEKRPAEDLFSVESLFGVPDSRQRPSSGFDPIGKQYLVSYL
jgi:hypothetical protein